jgi:hypothetical protein
MRAKSFLKFLLVLTITAFVVVSCEDPYEPIDYSQLEKDELQLLKQYLDSNLNGLKDSALTYIKKDTLIQDDTTAWYYFEMEKGSGDSILTGDIVGFRLKYYELGRDDNDDPEFRLIANNTASESPQFFEAGNTGSQGYPGLGLDMGIRYMRHLGKSKMIIPSKLGSRDYYTIMAEIEITHLIRE